MFQGSTHTKNMGAAIALCTGEAPRVQAPEIFFDRGNEVERIFGDLFALYDSLCRLEDRSALDHWTSSAPKVDQPEWMHMPLSALQRMIVYALFRREGILRVLEFLSRLDQIFSCGLNYCIVLCTHIVDNFVRLALSQMRREACTA